MYVNIYIYIYIYIYIGTHICTYICINICTCTCTHVHVFVCDPPYDVRDKGDKKPTTHQQNTLSVSNMRIYYFKQ